MTAIDRMVPTLGSTVHGPLGVVHLPRLWLKAVLKNVDALADGYTSGPNGFDLWTLEALGIAPDEAFGYLATLPDYLAFEAWVLARSPFDRAALAAQREKVCTYQKPEEKAAATRAKVGLDDPTERRSSLLNDLDDWDSAHRFVVAHAGDLEPMIPTISASSVGPLGARHLPRFWIKALLRGAGALPAGFNSAGGIGADSFSAKTLGFSDDAAAAFVAAERPNYLEFEAWIRANVADTSPATIARYNEAVGTRIKPPDKALEDRTELNIVDDPRITNESWLLNDLCDWKYLHDWALARRARTPA